MQARIRHQEKERCVTLYQQISTKLVDMKKNISDIESGVQKLKDQYYSVVKARKVLRRELLESSCTLEDLGESTITIRDEEEEEEYKVAEETRKEKIQEEKVKSLIKTQMEKYGSELKTNFDREVKRKIKETEENIAKKIEEKEKQQKKENEEKEKRRLREKKEQQKLMQDQQNKIDEQEKKIDEQKKKLEEQEQKIIEEKKKVEEEEQKKKIEEEQQKQQTSTSTTTTIQVASQDDVLIDEVIDITGYTKFETSAGEEVSILNGQLTPDQVKNPNKYIIYSDNGNCMIMQKPDPDTLTVPTPPQPTLPSLTIPPPPPTSQPTFPSSSSASSSSQPIASTSGEKTKDREGCILVKELSKPIRYECSKCGKSFSRKSDWRTHFNSNCGRDFESFKCPKCPQSTKTLTSFKEHYSRYHTLVPLHFCDKCSFTTFYNSRFSTHKKKDCPLQDGLPIVKPYESEELKEVVQKILAERSAQ